MIRQRNCHRRNLRLIGVANQTSRSQVLWLSAFGIRFSRFVVIALLPFAGGCRVESALPGGAFDAGPLFSSSTPMLVHEFRVTNTTGKAVRILNETHSCTCTSVAFAPKQLAPGESAPLEVKVRVPDGYSERKIHVTLKTDHPKFPSWTYEVQFVSYPEARIVPDRIELGSFVLRKDGGIAGAQDPSSARKEAWFETFTAAASSEHLSSPPPLLPVIRLT